MQLKKERAPQAEFSPERFTGGDRDYRGPYGYGRPAHGSDPHAHYIFAPEPRQVSMLAANVERASRTADDRGPGDEA